MQERQLRSGHFIFLAILGIVEAILTFWPKTWSELMPEPARIVIAIIGFIAIVSLLLWWAWPYLTRKSVKKLAIQDKSEKPKAKIKQIPTKIIPVVSYKKVLCILGQEPSNKRPIVMDSISTVCAVIIFTYGLLMLNLWRIGKLTLLNELSWFLFVSVLIIFPIVMLLNTWVWERKYYKLGKSAVEKHKTITIQGSINSVFSNCLQVINEKIKLRGGSRILIMERPKLIKALVGDSIITVETKSMERDVTNIYFQSDSQWLTTRWDNGLNQRNVDRIECLFLERIDKEKK